MCESSGDEQAGDSWIPYSRRKEWSDVKPLEQNEGKDPVARIAYSDKCKFLGQNRPYIPGFLGGGQ